MLYSLIRVSTICTSVSENAHTLETIGHHELNFSQHFGLILHTPGPEIRQHVAYIYIDTPCAYPPSYPSIRYA